MTTRTYMTEFADYDEQLPDLAPLHDWSWHNDTMPSFGQRFSEEDDPDLSGCIITLWIDYKNPENREIQGERFALIVSDDSMSKEHLITEAETWDELRLNLNRLYEAETGYFPDYDNGSDLPIGELVSMVGKIALLWGFSGDA